jgi:hypothetical protein
MTALPASSTRNATIEREERLKHQFACCTAFRGTFLGWTRIYHTLARWCEDKSWQLASRIVICPAPPLPLPKTPGTSNCLAWLAKLLLLEVIQPVSFE